MQIKQMNRKGISLIEVVVTMAILFIILPVVYSILFAGQNSFALSNNKGFAQQGVRYGHIVISDELRYASSFISDDDFSSFVTNTKFYGLRIQGNELLKTSYEYNATNLNYDETVIKRIPVDWDKVELSNTNSGKLDIMIYQDENSMNRTSDYDLTYTLELINSNLLDSDLVWDLSNGDNIYYTLGEDGSIGSISLSEGTTETLPPNNGSDPTVEDLTVSINKVRVKKDNSWYIINAVNGIYQVERKTEFQIVYQISTVSEGLNREFSLNSFLGKDSSEGTIFTISGTTKNQKDVGFLVSLSVSDYDEENKLRAKGQINVSLKTVKN